MSLDDKSTNTDVITSLEVEDMPVAPEPVESNWFSLMPMLLIFVLFYFFLIRPQEKRRREHENFVSSVKKGEEVVTNSGLFGIIRKINDNDDTVIIEIAKDVEIKILKNSISDIINRKKDNKTQPEKVAKKKTK